MEHSRLIRIALILLIIALLLFIIERAWTFGQFLGGVLSTLVAAWFVAFLIKPLVVQLQTGIIPPLVTEWLEQRYPTLPAGRLRLIRLPMSVAIVVAYLIFLVALIGGVTIATATIIPQAADLISRIPASPQPCPSNWPNSGPASRRASGLILPRWSSSSPARTSPAL